MKGEHVEPGERDGPYAPAPSDPFAMVKDVYAFMDTLATWDDARTLERATTQAEEGLDQRRL